MREDHEPSCKHWLKAGLGSEGRREEGIVANFDGHFIDHLLDKVSSRSLWLISSLV